MRPPRYKVDTITDIEKLDKEGFIHNPRLHGVSGLVRMEYRFTRVADGTLYENRLLVGGGRGCRRWITPLILQRFGFDHAHGLAWLRHNIEEVELFEHFLPQLFREEAGLCGVSIAGGDACLDSPDDFPDRNAPAPAHGSAHRLGDCS